MKANGAFTALTVRDVPPFFRQLPEGLETTDLGCFRDSQADRVFAKGLMGQDNMTPEVSSGRTWSCSLACLTTQPANHVR